MHLTRCFSFRDADEESFELFGGSKFPNRYFVYAFAFDLLAYLKT